MFRNTFSLIFALWLGHVGLAFAETTHFDLELSASHDNNVSRAENSPDIKSDNVLGLDLTGTRSLMLTPNSGILLNGGIQLAEYAHFNALSYLTASIGAAYRFQPVVGYTAPWIELGSKLDRLLFRDSDIRDGTQLEAHASIGKRFTDRIRMQAGLGWDHRWAHEGQVFELVQRRLFASADYKLSQDIALYGNWSRDFGDQVVASTPEQALHDVARAIAADPVFNGQNAYRISAIANIYGLGASLSINAANTLDIGVQHFQATGGGGIYDGTELRASWLYRFK